MMTDIPRRRLLSAHLLLSDLGVRGSYRPRRARATTTWGTCTGCGKPLDQGCRFEQCQRCIRAQRQLGPKPPAPVTRIAGYVPPAGSIAFGLLGRVVDPIRGLHV